MRRAGEGQSSDNDATLGGDAPRNEIAVGAGDDLFTRAIGQGLGERRKQRSGSSCELQPGLCGGVFRGRAASIDIRVKER